MIKTHSTEKGQALVLIVLSVVALFGFAALAVDLGRTYAERRRAQNAADASALAAAFSWQNAALNHVTTFTDVDAKKVAFDKAKLNGFSHVDGNTREDVVYYHPPISGPYKDNTEYFQIFVTTTVDQAFSQVVFTGSSRITVEAVARSRPSRSITPGDAMFATNRKSCDAIQFSGSGETHITGGNIFSNSDANDNSCPSLLRNGSGDVLVGAPYGIFASGRYDDSGNGGTASPAPQGNQGPKEIPDVPLPDCSNLPERTFDGSATILPGRYPAGIRITNGNYTMAAGMYCFYSDFVFNGGSLTGKDVIIVQWKGDIQLNGNGAIDLRRPNDYYPDGSDQHWGGMLIYMPASNHGGVDLAGGAGSTYTGTIYAPGPRDSSNAKCRVMGNSGSVGLSSNLICNTIEIGGNGGVIINYKEEQNYRMAPIVDLSQ